MIKNYLRVALRNIGRHKLYSIINILGLAVGIASAVVIFLVIQGELQFESHNTNLNNIYRINKKYVMKGQTSINLSTPFPLRQALEEIPEVAAAAQLTQSSCILKYEDKVFREAENVFASPEIFEIFTFEFVRGSAESAIPDKNSIAVSQTIAKKYFGNEDPIGKTLIINNRSEVTVKAIFKDFPVYTNYNFQIIQNIEKAAYPEDIDDWYSHWLETFVLLDASADLNLVEQKVDQLMKSNIEEQPGAVLQSLKNTHLYDVDGKPTAQKYIYIFGSVGLLVLIIACINFMNLATTQATKRAREIGVRKIVGAQKISLIMQFVSESMVFTFLSFLLALFMVELCLPMFENIISRPILFRPFTIFSGLIILGAVIIIGLISGSYPAFILSSFQPINALKTKLNAGKKGITLRTIIVVVQFTLAISLIIGTGTIYSQLKYMQKKDIGFERDNLLYLRLNSDLKEKYETFQNEITKITGIKNFTRSSSLPNAVWNIMRGISWEGNTSDEGSAFAFVAADDKFIETTGIEIIEGRNFNSDLASDENAILLNEKSLEMMGVENPLGLKMADDFEVIGVVKNFNSLPLNFEMEPLLISNIPQYYRYLLIRLDGSQTANSIEQIKKIWLQICPDFPYEYHFLDENFERTYQAERNAGNLFQIFAGLGIFIACLGLFGLASFLIEQKQLEIGIRKVMGSTVLGIIWQLSNQFVRWIVAANIIAWPLAWFGMNKWLQNFAYPTKMSIWIFIISGVIAFLIALITVSFRTIKAANSNPVKALKYE